MVRYYNGRLHSRTIFCAGNRWNKHGTSRATEQWAGTMRDDLAAFRSAEGSGEASARQFGVEIVLPWVYGAKMAGK